MKNPHYFYTFIIAPSVYLVSVLPSLIADKIQLIYYAATLITSS